MNLASRTMGLKIAAGLAGVAEEPGGIGES
jgi:hypothetical protein